MECELSNMENVDNMLIFLSALLTNQTKVALKDFFSRNLTINF